MIFFSKQNWNKMKMPAAAILESNKPILVKYECGFMIKVKFECTIIFEEISNICTVYIPADFTEILIDSCNWGAPLQTQFPLNSIFVHSFPFVCIFSVKQSLPSFLYHSFASETLKPRILFKFWRKTIVVAPVPQMLTK